MASARKRRIRRSTAYTEVDGGYGGRRRIRRSTADTEVDDDYKNNNQSFWLHCSVDARSPAGDNTGDGTERDKEKGDTYISVSGIDLRSTPTATKPSASVCDATTPKPLCSTLLVSAVLPNSNVNTTSIGPIPGVHQYIPAVVDFFPSGGLHSVFLSYIRFPSSPRNGVSYVFNSTGANSASVVTPLEGHWRRIDSTQNF